MIDTLKFTFVGQRGIGAAADADAVVILAHALTDKLNEVIEAVNGIQNQPLTPSPSVAPGQQGPTINGVAANVFKNCTVWPHPPRSRATGAEA